MCTVNADDTNVNTIRNKNAYTTKDYVEIGKLMLPYALLCANHVLNEFYNAFGVTGENYTEAYRNGNQNTENQESESLESGYAPRYLVKTRRSTEKACAGTCSDFRRRASNRRKEVSRRRA